MLRANRVGGQTVESAWRRLGSDPAKVTPLSLFSLIADAMNGTAYEPPLHALLLVECRRENVKTGGNELAATRH